MDVLKCVSIKINMYIDENRTCFTYELPPDN